MIEQNAIIENKADAKLKVDVYFDMLGYEDSYLISSSGKIYSKKNKIVLKPFLNTKGYPSVTLKGKTKVVHRLMAENFLPKINGKDQVNHKDGNKQNNTIYNLEWVNNRENILHYYNSEFSGIQKTKSNKYSVKIQYNNKQIYLGTYKRISDARLAYLIAKNNYDGINN